MLFSQNIVVHFMFIYCIGATRVPRQVSRDIAPTDAILQVIIEIFSCLNIIFNGNNNKKELPIHNYVVGFSQYKSENWKEILRLTSINIKTDNSSIDYISTVINEIMNRKNKTGWEIDIRKVDEVNNESKKFLSKLKEVYLRKILYRILNNKTSLLMVKNRASHSPYNKKIVAGEVNLAENGTEDIEVWVPSHSRRIFRGRQTRIYHYPFMASIHIFNQFTCAGSIIAADLVITAASCLQLAYNNRFYRENAQFLAVRVGSSYYGVAGDLIPVLEVYFHPLYDPSTLHNNLAIMRLHRYVRLRDHSRVKKVDIDTNANALPWNTDGIVIVGWGAKTTANKIKDPLVNKIAISILDFYPLEACQEIYSKKFVTERHFCAGFMTRGGGACNRDVGAPGLAGGLLVGVVSFGSASCGAADAPTVFTKLGYYTDWIEEVMAQDTSHYINKAKVTERPHPIQTIETINPISRQFVLELREPPRSDSYEQLPTNMRQMAERSIEFSEPTENKNTQGHVDVPSATTIHNFILRDQISKFTVYDKLLRIDKLKTKSHMSKQLRKPVHSMGRAGLPRDEYSEATETKLDLKQIVQLDADDSEVADKLLNEVNAKLDMKYTDKDKVPQKHKINIGIGRVLPELQSMENEHVDLAYSEVMAMPLPEIVLPEKQSTAGKIKEKALFKKVENSPKINEKDLVTEQPEVTFSDPELNQQINDLIDYINIIDKNSLEQEYFPNAENIINVNKTLEDLKILEIVDDKLELTENNNTLNLDNLNEIDDDNLESTEDNTLNLQNLNEIVLT